MQRHNLRYSRDKSQTNSRALGDQERMCSRDNERQIIPILRAAFAAATQAERCGDEGAEAFLPVTGREARAIHERRSAGGFSGRTAGNARNVVSAAAVGALNSRAQASGGGQRQRTPMLCR